MAPFTLLLVPFFILKVMKIPVTLSSYKQAMMTAIQRHAIGKLFLTFKGRGGFMLLGQLIYVGDFFHH